MELGGSCAHPCLISHSLGIFRQFIYLKISDLGKLRFSFGKPSRDGAAALFKRIYM